MYHATIRTIAAGAALAVAAALPLLAGTEAYAGKKSKEIFIQEYQVDEPLHGYSGHAGGYYCDYQRIPNRVCTVTASGKEVCKIEGYTLRQMCQ